MTDRAIRSVLRGFSIWLACLATWSIVIKYVDPVVWALAEKWSGRSPGPPPILFDFWPVAHVLLAVYLVRGGAFALPFALTVSVAEIGIVVVKLGAFLAAPETSFQRLSWALNKTFVLATFLALLPLLLRRDFRRVLAERPE